MVTGVGVRDEAAREGFLNGAVCADGVGKIIDHSRSWLIRRALVA
ncbi:hypothetical protein [Nocardia abscessus]|nr:hypothetical protein [Nocardia abscessus]